MSLHHGSVANIENALSYNPNITALRVSYPEAGARQDALII